MCNVLKMKIALTGTHGTGKTTIGHELVSKLKKEGIDTDFLGELARKCPFPLNEKTTKKSQIWIILNQIIKEMENESKCDLLICDRSILDGYCYYVNKFGNLKEIEPLIKKHLQTYNLIIKIPIRKGFLKKDKIRSVNKKFQEDIDKKTEELLKHFNIQAIKFKEKEITNEKIVERIIRVIKKLHKNL